MKIYITRNIPENGLKKIKESGIGFDINKKDRPLKKRELIKVFKKNKYDAVISLLTDMIDKNVIDVMKKSGVKIISNYAVGYNNIDVRYAKESGIIVANTPATSGGEVAEHAIALMFALSSRIVEMDSFVRSGRYNGWDPLLLKRPELSGQSLGIIGAGDIGSHMAYFCNKGLSMNILYSDINKNEKIEKDLNAKYREIDDLIKEADIISLHVPLNKHTKHLINKERLAEMKDSALLINTSRGAVIDEKALVDALKNNMISGAGIDVFEFEPELTKGLKYLPNVVLTPHIASATLKNRIDMADICTENVVSFFKKDTCQNIVN